MARKAARRRHEQTREGSQIAMRPDPKVLAKLARLAGIVESPPFTENLYGFALLTTNVKRFEADIIGNIETAHYCSALTNARKLKNAKRVGRLARELTKALGANKDQWEQILRSTLDTPTLDTLNAMLNKLAKEAQTIERLKNSKRGKAQEVTRKVFIEGLLDAAHSAGGEFKLNRRTGRGSLTEALEVLAPYLPAEFSAKNSPATLRRVKQAWLKNRENKVFKR
jgi:hypothetical protein